jgi:hypothetical protein
MSTGELSTLVCTLIFSRRIAEVADRGPVKHPRGHAYHEPSTQPIPLLAMRLNFIRSKEDVFGGIGPTNRQIAVNRPRSASEPTAYSYNDVKIETSSLVSRADSS